MTTVIKPSIGRVVLVHMGASAQPEPGLICYVWNDRMINIGGFDSNGKPFALTSVQLLQGDDVATGLIYAEWMPYQKGQAAKTEAVESELRELRPSGVVMPPKLDALQAMVDRFLGWKLPVDFWPDAGISFAPHASQTHDSPYWPTGTNLLHAGQALEMFKHCVGLPEAEIESKAYADGTIATGVSPLPDSSPGEQDAIEQERQAKGFIAPRITMADIESNIASENYFNAQNGIDGCYSHGAPQIDGLKHITFCILVLKNGTKIVGTNYGPVSPENFDADMGRRKARNAAIEQVWPLMGYELRNKLASGEGQA